MRCGAHEGEAVTGAALKARNLCEAFAATVAERPDQVAMRSSDGAVSRT